MTILHSSYCRVRRFFSLKKKKLELLAKRVLDRQEYKVDEESNIECGVECGELINEDLRTTGYSGQLRIFRTLNSLLMIT